MSFINKSLWASSLVVALSSVSVAEIKLPSFFSDSMVIQQETGAKIWGSADAGQDVKVSFADKSESAKAGKDGKWMVEFKGLKASKKGAQLTIQAGEEKKLINDVLVGEVWIASGQSNMEWTMDRTDNLEAIKNDSDDLLRVYVSGNVTAVKDLTDFPGAWKPTDPKNNAKFTAVGYEFGKVLRKKLDVPVGIIECSWGGKPVEAFTSEEALKLCPEAKIVLDRKANALKKYDPVKAAEIHKKALAKWKVANDAWVAETKANKGQKKRRPRQPQLQSDPALNSKFHSTIYHGMIAPIIGYGARGAIWYQGESNAGGGTDVHYGELLECLIQDWRKRWGINLSFYFVQLANFKNGPGWVNVQDEMRRLLDDSNSETGHVGMATINDIGAARDIHPKNKRDVGARLARWALNQDYGMKDVVVSGPLYKSSEVKGNTIEITFDHAKGLKSRDGEPLGAFEVAGADGQWKAAEAKIADAKIILSSKDVAAPTKARYAWVSFPVGANLVNAEGLPTSCFETK